MSRFDTDTAVTQAQEGTYSAEVRPGWTSLGGSPNGGYLMALALAAMSRSLDGAQPLSATTHYLKPGVLGPAEVNITAVKRGRVKSTAAATLSQEGGERLYVLGSFSSAITGPSGFTLAPPKLPAPEDCLPAPDVVAAAADIAQRFEYRVTPATRWVKGTTGDVAQVEGWIRFADGREPDIAAIPLLVDAFPPSIYEVVEMAIVPTLELTVHVRQAPAPGWIQARFTSRALINGLLEEDGELWDSQGNLIAMSRQLALLQPMG